MLVMPQSISCGYFDSRIFAGLDASPDRKIGEYEIELFLEDGKTTFRDGRNIKF